MMSAQLFIAPTVPVAPASRPATPATPERGFEALLEKAVERQPQAAGRRDSEHASTTGLEARSTHANEHAAHRRDDPVQESTPAHAGTPSDEVVAEEEALTVVAPVESAVAEVVEAEQPQGNQALVAVDALGDTPEATLPAEVGGTPPAAETETWVEQEPVTLEQTTQALGDALAELLAAGALAEEQAAASVAPTPTTPSTDGAPAAEVVASTTAAPAVVIADTSHEGDALLDVPGELAHDGESTAHQSTQAQTGRSILVPASSASDVAPVAAGHVQAEEAGKTVAASSAAADHARPDAPGRDVAAAASAGAGAGQVRSHDGAPRLLAERNPAVDVTAVAAGHAAQKAQPATQATPSAGSGEEVAPAAVVAPVSTSQEIPADLGLGVLRGAPAGQSVEHSSPTQGGIARGAAVVQRLAEVARALENAPPPRSVVVEIESMRGLRVEVRLGDNGAVHVMARGHGDAVQPLASLGRDLEAALSERGMHLADYEARDESNGARGRDTEDARDGRQPRSARPTIRPLGVAQPPAGRTLTGLRL